jgi:hypothetical protein
MLGAIPQGELVDEDAAEHVALGGESAGGGDGAVQAEGVLLPASALPIAQSVMIYAQVSVRRSLETEYPSGPCSISENE